MDEPVVVVGRHQQPQDVGGVGAILALGQAALLTQQLQPQSGAGQANGAGANGSGPTPKT